MIGAGMRAFLTGIVVCGVVVASGTAQTDLLTNGGFESGASGWENLGPGDIVLTGARTGSACVRMTSANAKMISQSVAVTSGHTYTFLGWIKTVAFGDSDWGYIDINAGGGGSVNSRGTGFPRDEWYKIAITFTAESDRQGGAFGVFGPQPLADLYFDDFALIEKSRNLAPAIDPRASTASGTVPLTVNFQAHGDDPDGAIAVYQWLFGDGAESAEQDPTHVYHSRGSYTITLNVWDNDGANSSRSLTIAVSDDAAPRVTIAAPSTNAAWSTEEGVTPLSGSTQAASGRQVTAVSWDNVTADTAGIVPVTAAASLNWDAGTISLKPGKNEILVTAMQSDGRTATDMIVITRTSNGPVIAGVSMNGTNIPVFGKCEVTFNLATVAEKTLYRFDANPPPGVTPGTGVTVEGIITGPNGGVLRHPAFYHEECVVDAENKGTPTHFAEPSSYRGVWKLRFAPTEVGTHQVALEARDASGVTSVSAGSFVAVKAVAGSHGFIRTSSDDPRYQEYSDRTLYMPTGPAWGPDFAANRGSGLNWERPWMGGSGMYSANWSRWKSTGEIWGNEGAAAPLEYREHYPSHELSGKIWWPEGYRIWISAFCDNSFVHHFTQGHTYQIKVRFKTAGMAGPANPAYPWGLMLKTHGWPGDSVARDIRNVPSMIPVCSTNTDWHTVMVRYAHTGNNSDFSIYLDNVTTGRAWLDQVSIREVKGDGSLGGEMVRNSLADMHSYVEQRPGAWFDWQVEQAARYGIGLEYVVQDKNDWVPNHLNDNGTFGEHGTGYYAPEGTKTRWLQQQWWRYLAARYGYSTGVRAWELCNEGPPDDGTGEHARATQEFAAYMHAIDAHRHQVSTSFWCCWEPTFWGDRTRFRDVDYGDIHWYPDQPVMTNDMAFFIDSAARMVAADLPGVPVQFGELGMAGSAGTALQANNDGTFYHNLLWSQLNSAGLSAPGYWHPEHMNGFDRVTVTAPFGAFCRSLDLNRGGYVPLKATVSDNGIRIQGQKNLASGKAHVWVQNKKHNWSTVMNNASAVGAVSGTVTIGMAPNTRYAVYRFDTHTGTTTDLGSMQAEGNGNLALSVQDLQKDIAFAVGFDPRVAAVTDPVALTYPVTKAATYATQVFPNPTHGRVVMRFSLPGNTTVETAIFDSRGALVRRLPATTHGNGEHAIGWDGADLHGRPVGSGSYLLRISTGDRVLNERLSVIR